MLPEASLHGPAVRFLRGYVSFTTGLRSSARGDWKTPTGLYARLVAGRFDTSDRHDGTFDAFSMRWPSPWFCNPEYGRAIRRWTGCMPSAGPGVALLPARTDTRWFHSNVLSYARLEFLPGRLHFDGGGPAPFPSMLAWYGGEK